MIVNGYELIPVGFESFVISIPDADGDKGHARVMSDVAASWADGTPVEFDPLYKGWWAYDTARENGDLCHSLSEAVWKAVQYAEDERYGPCDAFGEDVDALIAELPEEAWERVYVS